MVMHKQACAHLSAPSALSFCSAARALSGVCLLKVATRMYPIFPEPSAAGASALGAASVTARLALPHSCEVTGLILIFSRFNVTSRTPSPLCGFSFSTTCGHLQIVTPSW